MSTDHNQRLGFGRYGKKAHGREEHGRKQKKKSKQIIKEVTIAEAKTQLLATGEIRKVLAVIGGGKEATVLLAENIHEELVCAKVFRYFTSTIKKRLRGTKHLLASDMAALAAKQEFWNLEEMHKIIPVPRPISLVDNIVIMDFIAEDKGSTTPAPLIRDVNLTFYDPEELFYESIDIIANLFLKGHFIHGDYSEHNLMLTQKGKLLTMDVSQSVQFNTHTFVDTPMRIRIDKAVKLLVTDIQNTNHFFKRTYKIGIDPLEVKEQIVKELPDKLQNFLEKTMEIYPSAMYCPDAYVGKEQYRTEKVFRRSGMSRQQPK
ncbi:MAG: RIO1 family regulatory kinase/ATPase domain-containing protein [Candidatus Hodarchaeales archaeon]